MMEPDSAVNWLAEHRAGRPYFQADTDENAAADWPRGPRFSRAVADGNLLFADNAFNNHVMNGGKAISPYDEGRVDFGDDNLEVRLVQGLDEKQLWKTLRRTIRATNGIDPDEPEELTDPEEMFKGGLQTALETQVVVFEVIGASRVLTHQLVRSRRAAFHQQSQRATWYGDRPNQRWPNSVLATDEKNVGPSVQDAWDKALLACWAAYKAACDAGISYQDARYILPEGTTNYILCEYPLREFIAMFQYRGCSMFQWEMVACARAMRKALLEAHPFLDPYIKISCEKAVGVCATCKGGGYMTDRPTSPYSFVDLTCPDCGGDGKSRKCTFQGWENVEGQCSFPWARQNNRVFLPSPRNRIGA